MEPELHAHALYTTVFHDVGAFLNTSSFPRGRDGLEGGLVVLGAFHFVQRVFVQVCSSENSSVGGRETETECVCLFVCVCVCVCVLSLINI